MTKGTADSASFASSGFAKVISGGQIPDTARSAYSLHVPETITMPLVIAVPHAGRDYPDYAVEAMREPAWSKLRLEDRYIDRVGQKIAQASGAAILIAHAPRALLDLNRSPQDIDWGMISGAGIRRAANSHANRRARGGLGLVPRRLPGLGEIWQSQLTCENLDARIEGIHRPYHAALGRMLEDLRDQFGASLLVDLHSMPPLRPSSAGEKAAEFVIGDRFGASAHENLSQNALANLRGAGRKVAHNRPYSGGFVLDHHASPRRNIFALQIEVCRSLYLDAALDEPTGEVAQIAKELSAMVRELAWETIALGDPKGIRQAAE